MRHALLYESALARDIVARQDGLLQGLISIIVGAGHARECVGAKPFVAEAAPTELLHRLVTLFTL